MLATTKLLPRQNYACRDQHVFVVSKKCRMWQMYVCVDKTFVATSIQFSRQKTCFVATEVSYKCDKHTNMHDKHKNMFVATKDEVFRDKHVFNATNRIVAAKMILAAAHANDTKRLDVRF